MSIENMTSQAHDIIEKSVQNFRSQAIMWSGGKDSMVLLHLIREHFDGKIPFPVIFHREPFFPEKFTFHHHVEWKWGFCAIDYSPSRTSLQKNNGVLEIARHYQIGPSKCSLVPVSHYEDDMKQGEFLCGLDDLMRRPLGTYGYRWELVFIGHKSCDTDAFFGGGIPLNVDFKINTDCVSAAFPIRNWSHDDIWDYIIENDVPYDMERYDIETRTERKDKSLNSDWYQCCVRCLDRDGPPVVDCPKLDAQVDNISNQFQYTDPVELAYFGDNNATNSDAARTR